MLIALFILIFGIILLIFGGELLVRGAVSLADRLGISPLMIGLTIVAFGTSAPELALNSIAAFRGQTDLCFGNIVGSNIANIGLILGITALIKPLAVHSQVIKRELPMMILTTIVVCFMSLSWPLLFHGDATVHTFWHGAISRADGIIMLLGFTGFFFYQLHINKHGSKYEIKSDVAIEGLIEEAEQGRVGSLPLAIFMFLIGLGLLILGGDLAGRGAAKVAARLGMGEDLIGLTIVAVATSLPELATSFAALRRNQTDIAVGNIVGSNLFNLLIVLGATATIRKVPIPIPVGGMSLLIMLILALILWPMASLRNRRICRFEGVILLLIYFFYMGWSVWQHLSATE